MGFPKFPLPLQVLSTRLSGLAAPLLPVATIAQQLPFYRDKFPVHVYGSIAELTAATATLTWTEDPWDGNLDVVKHPTFMQEAIAQHPDFAGDCDDHTAYDCVALHKSKLADEQWFATVMWLDNKTKSVEGHAVCVFRVKDRWFYMGNWNRCVPIPLHDRTTWVCDVEQRTGCRAITASMWRAYGTVNDSMMLDRCVSVKR